MSTTLFFIDSFDHYSTAQLLRKWTTGTGNIVAGRTGNGLQISGVGPMKTLNSVEQVTLTAGWAYKTTNFSNYIISFLNVINGIRVQLDHVGDGRFRFRYFAA